jgi:hypothetical protein
VGAAPLQDLLGGIDHRAVDGAGDGGDSSPAVTATIASSSNTKPSPTRPSLTLARPWSCSRLHDLDSLLGTVADSTCSNFGFLETAKYGNRRSAWQWTLDS